jgi:hypothetical protein
MVQGDQVYASERIRQCERLHDRVCGEVQDLLVIKKIQIAWLP